MKKILVVDDDKKFLEFIQELLSHMDYQVLLALDGEEALQILHAEKPDLMILDLVMPKMHGYEVCELIRADSAEEISGIKIIAVSGKSYPVDMKRAQQLGVNTYLVKPFGYPELREAVSKLLESTS